MAGMSLTANDLTRRADFLSPRRLSELTSLVTASTQQTRTHDSPLDGAPIAPVPLSSPDDVLDAVEVARRVQESWALTGWRERSDILLRLHDLLFDHQVELMDLIQLESGKTRAHAFDEIAHVALTARYYARTLRKHLRSRSRPGVMPGLTKAQVNRVPKGIVGIISPWNYPLSMALADGIPAIAAGNAVVHKPDSQTPLTALAGVELLYEAGLPRDLWQVVAGPGSVVGTPIIGRADYVCFTGSTATGKRVATQAAERLINYSLELGGKNPALVLSDADPNRAARDAVTACFASAGQLCVSIERIYVLDSVYDDFVTAFADRTSHLALSTEIGFGADVGSLVSESQLQTVERHVDDAVAKGATVLAGGRSRPDLGPFVYEPTILSDVTPAMEVYAEETFGPLVSIYRVSTEDEAVERANDTEYGLNAAIFTGDAAHGRALASRIKAGTVNVNEGFAATFASLHTPMGGMKNSGVGRRQAEEGIWRYTEPQAVASQALVPIAGPDFLSDAGYSKVMTAALRAMRRTWRA